MHRFKSLKRFFLGAVVAGLAFGGASANSLYLFGEIGRFPALVLLERDGGKLSGWYFYIRQGKEIRIDGKIDDRNLFAFDEFDPQTGAKTAHFAGTLAANVWTGTWQKTSGGAPLPFAFRESRDASLDGRVRCAAKEKDRQSSYTFAASLDLAVARGKVTTFSIDHTAQSRDDEQSCSVDLKSLRQIPSDKGILMGTKNPTPDQECAVRIVGNDAYLYVQMGDCKGDADEMFCSARGSWSDLVVERRSGVCRIVE